MKTARELLGAVPKPYFKTTDRLNVPRINYSDGKPAILVEPQRTNLITHSNDFSNSSWLKLLGSTATPNVLISPKGTLNGWSFKTGTVTYSSILSMSARADGTRVKLSVDNSNNLTAVLA